MQNEWLVKAHYKFRHLFIVKYLINFVVGENVRTIQSLLDVREGDNVLDICCGPGRVTRKLALITKSGITVGLDISMHQLKQARKALHSVKGNVILIQADAEKLPFSRESFDKIYCWVGLIIDLNKTFKDIFQILRNKGIFCGASFAKSELPWVKKVEITLGKKLGINFIDLDMIKTYIDKVNFVEFKYVREGRYAYFKARK